LSCASVKKSVSLPDQLWRRKSGSMICAASTILASAARSGWGSLEMSTSRSTGASLAVIFFSATASGGGDFSGTAATIRAIEIGRSMGGAYSMRERSP